MTHRLADKVAIVTGAAGGIGRVICQVFAAEGAQVACVDLDEAGCRATSNAITASGGAARAYAADLSSREATHALMARIDRELGRIDVLVNNAMWIKVEPIEAVREETVERMFGIGLKAVIWTTQAAIPALSRSGGSIINMASISAIRGSNDRIAYNAVKGGVVSMTLGCAVELGPQRIRVNAIAPGAVPFPATAKRIGPAALQRRIDTTPLGRLASPEDVAAVALFLASDESAFITGTVMPVDGGRSISS